MLQGNENHTYCYFKLALLGQLIAPTATKNPGLNSIILHSCQWSCGQFKVSFVDSNLHQTGCQSVRPWSSGHMWCIVSVWVQQVWWTAAPPRARATAPALSVGSADTCPSLWPAQFPHCHSRVGPHQENTSRTFTEGAEWPTGAM